MRARFPSDRRSTWRQRFVAIGRQAAAPAAALAAEVEGPRPRVQGLAEKVAIRVRFAAITTH